MAITFWSPWNSGKQVLDYHLIKIQVSHYNDHSFYDILSSQTKGNK